MSITTIQTTGEIAADSFNLIAEGTGENERIGRHIMVRSLDLHITLNLDSAAITTQNDAVRLIAYIDMQANGVVATVAEILSSTAINSFRNLFQSGRFKVIYDKTFHFNPGISGDGTTIDTAPIVRQIRAHLPINMKVDYEGATNGLTEVCCANIGMMAIAWGGKVDLSGIGRIRYTG